MLSLPDQPLVVVTGKGGTGKSTVAAALALAARRDGRRVIVAEVGARDELGRALGGDDGAPPLVERDLADGVRHVSIDPDAMLAEYLRDQLPGPVAALMSRSRAFGALAQAIPGMRELLTVGKAWELAQDHRRRSDATPHDLVIVDAPASGHGLGLLTAARTFAAAARSGPVARQATIIDAMVSDPEQTAVLAVCQAEEMAVNETVELAAELGSRLAPQRLTAVVVNGVLPRRFSGADRTTLAAAVARLPAGDPTRASVAAAAAVAERGADEQRRIAHLRRGLAPAPPIVTLRRRLASGPLGTDDLLALSHELVGR